MQTMRAGRKKREQLCPPLKASREEGATAAHSPRGETAADALVLPMGTGISQNIRNAPNTSFDSTRTSETIRGVGLPSTSLDLSENLGDPLAFQHR